jgi:hypothetical protein
MHCVTSPAQLSKLHFYRSKEKKTSLFSGTVSPLHGPLMPPDNPSSVISSFFSKIREDIRNAMCTTGGAEPTTAAGKLAIGANSKSASLYKTLHNSVTKQSF